ncbi:MAG TPA: DUF4214 domain-containing protein [Pirellulales bacterium]|nr:DUF4214 domain-containing protein [Pirellulales bacterium]
MYRWNFRNHSERAARKVGTKGCRKTRRSPRRRSPWLPLERLEERTVLSTVFTVTNTSNDPTVSGSLPFEVAQANASTDEAIVNFDPTAFATAQTITLKQTLTLDHSSEPTIPISIVGPAAGVTIAGGGSGSDFSVITVTSDTQQAAIKGASPSAPITITDGNLPSTTTESGAGINDLGDLTLEYVAITNNTAASGGGGGIEVSGGPTVSSSFSINPGAALVASDTTFSGNTAAGAGGAVDMEGTGALIVNSTFSGNTAGTGGAIFNGPMLAPASVLPANLGVVNCTISGNTASNDGGGIDNNNAGVMGLLNTIVTGNTVGGTGTNPDVDGGGGSGVYQGSSHDLIGNANGLAGTGITDGTNGNVVGHPALLAPFGSYGGANQTFALLPGSPAINDALVLANLSANAAVGDTTIQASTPLPLPSLNGSTFPYQQGKVILIGSEQMLVTGVSGSAKNGYTLTVTRGVNGTTAAAHNANDPIFLPDERGVFSASNSIGAFQTQGFNVTVNSGDSPQSTQVSSAFANPLGVTVTAIDPNAPVDGGLITYTAPASGASAALSGGTATISGGTASVNATANGTAGSYAVTASAGFGTDATFNLTNTTGTTITLTPGSLPAANIGSAYSQQLTGNGGTGPFSFAVASGALPAGITLSSGGLISGTPTATGAFHFTVQATDSSASPGPFTGSLAYSLQVNPAGITISMTPASLPDGNVGSAFSQQLSGNGGTGPYSFAIVSGALPAGLTLSSGGLISGSPTATGAFNFTIQATDSSPSPGPFAGSLVYSLQVNPAGTPHQLYVEAVYEDVLGRAADAGGLAYWAHLLDSGAAVSSVAESIAHSNEYYANFVIRPAYLKLLGRAADDAGVSYWTGQMDAGVTDQQLEADLVSAGGTNGEFYTKAGGTNTLWIDAVYKLLLGRAADAAGETYWNGQLNAGVTLNQVAQGIAGSQENNTQLINEDYFHYLGRAADAGGLSYWLGQFADGKTNEDVIAGFTGSAEYYKQHTT